MRFDYAVVEKEYILKKTSNAYGRSEWDEAKVKVIEKGPGGIKVTYTKKSGAVGNEVFTFPGDGWELELIVKDWD